MARVKQVTTKPQKFMGDAMKATASSEKEIFKADDGRKRSKKEDKKQEEETKIEIESESESNSETESDIPLSKLKETSSKIDEGESSKKKEKMKLKMSDFVKISKANLDMMKEIKEMSGLTLSILEKSHELQKGIMAEHNAKMDMLINRLDRQEWFMKKMAQMLFGESFGKFRDFGNYPQGTAGPSNAKAAGPSGVKISEVEEEVEEHVEAAEKVQEESKLAEVEEVEKNDEKEKSAEEASAENKNLPKRHQENPPHLILQATTAVTMEKVKAEMVQDKKSRRKSSHKTHPLNNQTLFLLPLNQYLNQPSLYPCNTNLEEPKHKPENQFYTFLQKSKYPYLKKNPQRRSNKPNLLIPLTLGEVAEFLAAKTNLEIF
ncbi:hypothetical protein GH714_018052 [Hevea brasiliensis]|uniref:Uncharacterized protein n=1 Tax=Hevea brasiliensis TaxID=3981 RepID=A0A6A6K980_HEVBR|nr:hypothetical protein GH714_018052 [Hevea brasiliensis]